MPPQPAERGPDRRGLPRTAIRGRRENRGWARGRGQAGAGATPAFARAGGGHAMRSQRRKMCESGSPLAGEELSGGSRPYDCVASAITPGWTLTQCHPRQAAPASTIGARGVLVPIAQVRRSAQQPETARCRAAKSACPSRPMQMRPAGASGGASETAQRLPTVWMAAIPPSGRRMKPLARSKP